MPQMSPMLWIIMTALMLFSYMALLNSMPKLPITLSKGKKINNKKNYMEW